MDARELLQTIEARGGVATIRRDADAVKLNVSPRGIALDFASDIQRFKPQLLELLAHDDVESRSRFPPHLRAIFPDADQVAIGRNLLRLDAGLEIENEE